MQLYLTYNDAPSGIYYSQVIDVCRYYSEELKTPTKLFAFISARNFFASRRLIKSRYRNAFVFPMFPKAKYWKVNTLFLWFYLLFSSCKRIIARGPFTTNMALMVRRMGLIKHVVFDARGAYVAELNEYDVVNDEKLKKSIFEIERKAVMSSNHRLAVSDQLVQYWKRTFNYGSNEHVVIPCTLQGKAKPFGSNELAILENRQKNGFKKEDIVLVYAGSSAGWQSFDVLDDFVFKAMSQQENIKLLMLVKQIPINFKSYQQFGNRIVQKWVDASEVPNLLKIGDYGLLLREPSVTNKVSSPVKFAEYLQAGLKVLISEEIGDFTGFVKTHNCGMVVSKDLSSTIVGVGFDEKIRSNKLSSEFFIKEVYKTAYLQLLKANER